MDAEGLLAERAATDRFMAEHYASPIPEEHLGTFRGLDWYEPDPAWRLDGAWLPADGEKASVPTSNGGEMAYLRLGTVELVVGGDTYHLSAYDDGDGSPFIPFFDQTCGGESYRGGRYVAVEGLPERAVVDFNRAHNPYCAYDDEFVCPLPPPENRLRCSIEAGERAYRPPT